MTSGRKLFPYKNEILNKNQSKNLTSSDSSKSFQHFENSIMICICLAALEVTWLMIWHLNKVNKFPQDPPTDFETITQLVKRM